MQNCGNRKGFSVYKKVSLNIISTLITVIEFNDGNNHFQIKDKQMGPSCQVPHSNLE